MPVKAKNIKDLPLKNEFDGSESLLVQDSNGTKQAPLEVIVDEIKQNSQEKIREIENDLSTINVNKFNSLQQALNFASEHNKIVVIDSEIEITETVHVPSGVEIRGNGKGVLKRCFANVDNPICLQLHGNNIIQGITFNGNASNFTVENQDFIYYEDILCYSDKNTGNNKILNCKFENSIGSHIATKDNNLTIDGCDFGEYLDHAIYFGATNTNHVTTKNILIKNSTISAKNSTREALKGRNGFDNVLIENITFDLPLANLMTLDIGDANKLNRDGNNITIRNCRGNCTSIVSSSQSSKVDSSVKFLKNITLDDCQIEASSVAIQLGWLPKSSIENYSVCVDGVNIINSVIKCPYLILGNGRVGYGIKNVKVKNCNIEYSYDWLIDFVGDNINYAIEDCTIKSTHSNPKYARLFEIVQKKHYDLGLRPTIESEITIKNNTLINIHRLVNESTSSKGDTDWIYEIHSSENRLTGISDTVVLYCAVGMNANSSIPNKICYSINNTFYGSESISYPLKYLRQQIPAYNGTFTPTFETVDGQATFTYTKQDGKYVINNNIVILSFDIRISSKSSSTISGLKISGLPNLNYLHTHICNIANTNNVTSSSATHIFLRKLDDNENKIHIFKGNNSDLLYINDIDNNFMLQGSITLMLK